MGHVIVIMAHLYSLVYKNDDIYSMKCVLLSICILCHDRGHAIHCVVWESFCGANVLGGKKIFLTVANETLFDPCLFQMRGNDDYRRCPGRDSVSHTDGGVEKGCREY